VLDVEEESDKAGSVVGTPISIEAHFGDSRNIVIAETHGVNSGIELDGSGVVRLFE